MSKTDLPAIPETPGVLGLPTDDPWASVEDGFVGEAPPEIAPRLPLLNFNANKGEGFTDEATGEKIGEGDTVRVVWLAWSESRAYWEEEFGKGDKIPTCRSANMIAPDPASPSVQAATCAACPHSKWTDEAPECGVRVNVMLYLLDEQRITRTAFRGIALKHVAMYLGTFKSSLKGSRPMQFVTEISVHLEDTSYGDKLVPHFRVGEEISFDEARPLIAMRDEFTAQWKSLLAADLMREDGGDLDLKGADVVDAKAEPFPGAVDVTDEERDF